MIALRRFGCLSALGTLALVEGAARENAFVEKTEFILEMHCIDKPVCIPYTDGAEVGLIYLYLVHGAHGLGGTALFCSSFQMDSSMNT